MDNIYDVPKSKLINIKEFFDNYKTNLHLNEASLPTNDEEITKLLQFDGVNDRRFNELKDSVSLDLHLSQPDDIPTFDFCPGENVIFNHATTNFEVPKTALNLKTFNEIIRFKKKHIGSPFGQSILSYKIVSHKTIRTMNETKNLNNLEPYSDVIISIRFYRPYRYKTGHPVYGPKFAEEFLVLGSQYLTDLKDKISCICNKKIFIDISKDPDQPNPIDKTNSGFFFITNTFYNDTRNPNNSDYSEVIRKWSKTRKEFENSSIDNAAIMENTRFCDLNVSLGVPQVYQHHGNCEHLFTFSWIRLLSPEDILNRNNYPLLNSVAFPNTKLCNICADREYTFVVKKSQRQFHDPCYLCRLCFDSFYYIKGKKVGDFEAYRLNSNGTVDDDDNNDDDDDDVESVESMDLNSNEDEE